MPTITHNINFDSVKAHIPLVQAAIKEHLKVDAGKQASYHIFSVCNFLKNDQTLKSLYNKDTYTLTANLGSVELPCVIEHVLGNFENENDAKWEAENFIRKCQKQIEWNLLKNGELVTSGNSEYTYTIYSKPNPQRGLQVEIKLNAEKGSDIELMLENLTSEILDGFTEKSHAINDESYTFNVFGEEYDVVEDIDCLVDDNMYVIFDSKGIIESSDEEDDIHTIWENKDTEILTFNSYLVLGEFVELQDALENDECTYHAISRQSGTIYSGEIMDVLDSLKYEKHEFSIFREIQRT